MNTITIGSEKQIAWANDIREEMLGPWAAFCRREAAHYRPRAEESAKVQEIRRAAWGSSDNIEAWESLATAASAENHPKLATFASAVAWVLRRPEARWWIVNKHMSVEDLASERAGV